MASIASRQATRALVTRPRDDAETLAGALAARGVIALIEPMMQICYHGGAPDLECVQAVLATSGNGVRALARATTTRHLPLFAVGDATAARAGSEGFTTVESAGGDVADLARLVAHRLRPEGGRLLHVCGSVAAGGLAEELAARGFLVDRCTLYEARPVAELSHAAKAAISAGDIDFALFFSPRTAAIFVRLAKTAGVARHCDMIAALSISAAADAALGALAWRERHIAGRPEQQALLDLLDGLLAARRG